MKIKNTPITTEVQEERRKILRALLEQSHDRAAIKSSTFDVTAGGPPFQEPYSNPHDGVGAPLFAQSALFLFALEQRVGRLNPQLHRPGFTESVAAEGAPAPQFRRINQSPLYRIVMHVVQLLSMFAPAEDIEVIGALLPESRWQLGRPELYLNFGLLLSCPTAAGNTLFENLHGHSDSSLSGLADQQMEVLRHDDVTPDDKLIFLSDFLQDFQEQIAAAGGSEKGLSMITTAGDEVFVAAGVEALQTFGHAGFILSPPFASSARYKSALSAKDGAPIAW